MATTTDPTFYFTIEKSAMAEFKERGSKFVAFAYPIETTDDFKKLLQNLNKEHPKAVHHCFAYRIGTDGNNFRSSDDGEPSGTAGRPIHGQLLSKDLTNTLVVVIRYFGGTKLGVSGLINAYKTATKEALEASEILEKIVNDVYKITFDYLQMNDVMKLLKDENLHQFNQAFENNCSLQFSVRKNDVNRIYDAFNKIENLQIRFLRTE